jgi:hypothetical protein
VTGTELRPSRCRAGGWTLLGTAATGLAVWTLIDSDAHPGAIVLLVACVVVTAPFVLQLLAPGTFAWLLDDSGLVARRLTRRVRVSWDEVRLARMVSRAGEPALELRLEADGAPTTVTLRLPTGADTRALDDALARYLGAGADRTDGTEGRGAGHEGLGGRR